MSIRSRQHSKFNKQAQQPKLSMRTSLLALAAFGLPLAAQAQVQSQGQAPVAPKEAKLSEIQVNAEADSYKAERVSSPKLTQPLLDTTQTITVIKKELLIEQGASSLIDALRNTPGITLQLGENGNTSAGDTFQMRGFSTQSSIFVDGIRDLGAVSRDVFNIEQIEVSRGPAGTDVGRGAASGYINLSSKLPSLDEASSATLGYDSGEKLRATADINRRLGEGSAFRLNVMAEDGGQIGRKVIEKKNKGIAPSVAFGLGTPTRIYLYSQHIRQEGLPDGGVPAIGVENYFNATPAIQTAPRVSRDSFYGYNSDYEKTDADMATVKIEHQLGAKTTFTNTSRYGKSKLDRILTGINALTAPAGSAPNTWTVSRSRQSILQENKILGNTTNLVTEFTTGGIGHTLSTGLEFLTEEQFSPTRVGLGTVTNANLYNPNPADPLNAFAPVRNGVFTKGSTTTAAVYAFDTLKLNEQWQLNGGVRVEHYNTETDAASLSAAAQAPIPVGTLIGSHVEKSDKLVSWKAGALYKPTPDSSLYLAYATSQTPPGSASFGLSATAGNIANPAMDPQKTTNVELGGKWDVIQKKLALTATVYRTENKNEFPVLEDPVALIYSQGGNRRVEGVELGAVGQITRDWSISAGFATMDATIIEGVGTNVAGTATRWSPDRSATLWSTYKVNGALTVGGGARYMSEQKRVVAPGAAIGTGAPSIKAYTVADAVISYNISKLVSLQLNVYNVFDKAYVASLNNGGSRITIGTERSARLSANFAF